MFQAHPWHGVPPGDPAGVVEAYIEIVTTDTVKFELDQESGHLRIDRPQRFSSQPPTPYGNLRDIADAPQGVIERLRHYFLTHKQMPGEPARTVRIAEVYDRVEAVEVIRRSLEDYRESFGDPQTRAAQLARLIGQGG